MKIVLLLDSCNHDFLEIINNSDIKDSVYIDTQSSNEMFEFAHLKRNIDNFKKSSKHLMIARYSGRNAVSKDIGDECSEMIIPVNMEKMIVETGSSEQSIQEILKMINKFIKED
jgi:hypothetical protein